MPIQLLLERTASVRGARGKRPLVKVTLWSANTPSSKVTPSQINVWLEIRRRSEAALLDFNKSANLDDVANFAAVKAGERKDADIAAQLHVRGNFLQRLHDVRQ